MRRVAIAVISFVAVAAASASERRHVNLPTRAIAAPFSDAVLVGDTLYLSGRLGLDAATGMPPADAELEARLVMDGIRDVLIAAGMSMDDLVMVQVFCPDVKLYDVFNQVYRSYFSIVALEEGRFPARAFIGSGPLLRGARFEVLGVAVRAVREPAKEKKPEPEPERVVLPGAGG